MLLLGKNKGVLFQPRGTRLCVLTAAEAHGPAPFCPGGTPGPGRGWNQHGGRASRRRSWGAAPAQRCPRGAPGHQGLRPQVWKTTGLGRLWAA